MFTCLGKTETLPEYPELGQHLVGLTDMAPSELCRVCSDITSARRIS